MARKQLIASGHAQGPFIGSCISMLHMICQGPVLTALLDLSLSGIGQD